MINLTVKTSDIARTVNIDPATSTPAEVFRTLGVDVSRAQVTLDGAMVGNVSRTFADLAVEDGKPHTLRATVKSDGAAA